MHFAFSRIQASWLSDIVCVFVSSCLGYILLLLLFVFSQNLTRHSTTLKPKTAAAANTSIFPVVSLSSFFHPSIEPKDPRNQDAQMKKRMVLQHVKPENMNLKSRGGTCAFLLSLPSTAYAYSRFSSFLGKTWQNYCELVFFRL